MRFFDGQAMHSPILIGRLLPQERRGMACLFVLILSEKGRFLPLYAQGLIGFPFTEIWFPSS